MGAGGGSGLRLFNYISSDLFIEGDDGRGNVGEKVEKTY